MSLAIIFGGLPHAEIATARSIENGKALQEKREQECVKRNVDHCTKEIQNSIDGGYFHSRGAHCTRTSEQMFKDYSQSFVDDLKERGYQVEPAMAEKFIDLRVSKWPVWKITGPTQEK